MSNPVLSTITRLQTLVRSFLGRGKPRRAEPALPKGEERFQHLVETAPGAIVVVAENGRILLVNERVELLFGYQRAELVEMQIEQLLPERYRGMHQTYRADFVSQPEVRTMGGGRELAGQRKDGSEFPIEIELSASHTEAGTLLFAFVTDLTERKQAEEFLIESIKRHSIVSGLISDYACAYHFLSDNNDDDAQLEWVFGTFEETSGLSIDAALSAFRLSEPVYPDDLPIFQQRQRRLRSGQADVSEFRIINKKGQVRWLRGYGRPEWDAEHRTVIRVYAAVQDITERKQAEAALRESEQRFSRVFHSSPIATALTRLSDTHFIDVNEKMTVLTGFARDELIGRTSLELNLFVKPELRSRLTQITQQNDVYRDVEIELRTKTGAVREVLLSIVSIELGGEEHVISMVYDITERKQAIEALRENQAFIQRVADTSPQITYVYDLLEQRNVYASRELAQVLGYPGDAIQSKEQATFQHLLHPDELALIPTRLARFATARNDDILESEMRFLDSMGQVRWLYLREVVFSRNTDGSPRQILGVATDITERRQAETALRASEARLRQAMNVAHLGIWDWDIATDMTIWTGDMFRMYGVAPDEFTGKGTDYLDLTHPEDRTMQSDNIGKAFERGITEQELTENKVNVPLDPQGFRILRRDGTVCYVQGDAVAIVNEQHQPVRMIGILQDVTELKLAEAARSDHEHVLNLLKTEQEWNAAIQRMIKVFSHELRNPLAGIQASADLMIRFADQHSAEWGREKLAKISSQVQHMTQILDDVVRVVQNAFQRDIFRPSMINLAQICQVMIEELQDTIGAKHRLIFVTDERIKQVYADENLITRILINLLSNAIKYSPEASEIRLELRGEDELTLSVSDEGIGIAAEDQAHIFESFFRADHVGTIQGTGLGLSIVRDCVELHHGQISVESQVGRGSTFKVWLPLEIDPLH